MANVTDDSYLLKLLRQRKPPEFIGWKLGLSVEEVQSRIENLRKMAEEREQNGAAELAQLQAVTENQLQLMGYSLGLYQAAFTSRPEPTELKAIIDSCPPGSDLAVYLLKRLIILRPFSMPSPARMIEQLEKK